MPAGHRPGTFLGPPPADAGHRYISDTRLSSPSTRARHVPDGRPYCSPWITRGEGGPPMRGGSQLTPTVKLTEAPALHRAQARRPGHRPGTDPAPSSGPEAAYASVHLQPQTVVLGSAPNWVNYWREEDIYNSCRFIW